MAEEFESEAEVGSESAERRGCGPIRLEYATPVRDRLSYAGLGCALSAAHFALLAAGLVIFFCTYDGPVFIEQAGGPAWLVPLMLPVKAAEWLGLRVPPGMGTFAFVFGNSLIYGFGVAYLVRGIRRHRAAKGGRIGQIVDGRGRPA